MPKLSSSVLDNVLWPGMSNVRARCHSTRAEDIQMTLTREQVEALLGSEQQADKGPWQPRRTSDGMVGMSSPVRPWLIGPNQMNPGNIQFLCAIRNAAPELLADWLRMDTMLRRIKENEAL